MLDGRSIRTGGSIGGPIGAVYWRDILRFAVVAPKRQQKQRMAQRTTKRMMRGIPIPSAMPREMASVVDSVLIARALPQRASNTRDCIVRTYTENENREC